MLKLAKCVMWRLKMAGKYLIGLITIRRINVSDSNHVTLWRAQNRKRKKERGDDMQIYEEKVNKNQNLKREQKQLTNNLI